MNGINLIFLDVDGTMTDGQIYYDSFGNEMKSFNVKDGMAISQATSLGIEFAIVTGRKSEIVSKRAKELGINLVYQGIKNKKDIVKMVMYEKKKDSKEVLFIGDDINDLDSMMYSGYSACPLDACEEVKNVANIVSNYDGGKGAIREIVENVLKQKKQWGTIITDFKYKNQ